jgi:hypothetical protein
MVGYGNCKYIGTGVIRSEAAKLRCDQVDFASTVLYIEGLLSRNIV